MIQILYLDLPPSVGGFTRQNEDDSYTICLNQNHTYEQNRQTALHELSHIKGRDFDAHIDVSLLECIRHRGA